MFPLPQNAVAFLAVALLVADWFVSFRLIGGEHAGTAFVIFLFLGGAAIGRVFCPQDTPVPPDDPSIS